MTQKRDKQGRFASGKDHTTRNRAIGAAALGAVAAIGAGIFAAFKTGTVEKLRRRNEGHDAPDLVATTHPDGTARAPDHFRPDGDAPVDDADRAAMAPATVPAPKSADMQSKELKADTVH